MREYHETDILQKCCRICGKTSPQEKIHRLRPDEAHWFKLQLARDNKICWICRSLYAAHKENEFEKGNFELKFGFLKTFYLNAKKFNVTLVSEKFNLPDHRIPDSTNCSEATPCYFCKISIEYEDACLFDQAEKDAKAKKRKFKVKSFLLERLKNKQNDIHTKQAFHNKEPIKNCSRIEYHGDDLRK